MLEILQIRQVFFFEKDYHYCRFPAAAAAQSKKMEKNPIFIKF